MNQNLIGSIQPYIQDNKLTGISYLTATNPEIVHPRIVNRAGGVYVYGRSGNSSQKQEFELIEFLKLVATGARGLAVGGYRTSDGRQTSISFSQRTRITYSAGFEELILRLI